MSKIISANGAGGSFCTEVDDGKTDLIVQDFYCSLCGSKMTETRTKEERYNNATGGKITKVIVSLSCPKSPQVVPDFNMRYDRHDSYSFTSTS